MRTIFSVVLLVITGLQIATATEKCSRPSIKRDQLFIYKIIKETKVNVYRCQFNDGRIAYTDISDNCLANGFKAGTSKDRWNRPHPNVIRDIEMATVDLLKNQIRLRSGTVCRYDRGFCYDPKRNNDYGVVWDIPTMPEKNCSSRLEQIFYGYIDVWTFKGQNLRYLFFNNPDTDLSFTLRLAEPSTCFDTPSWYSDDKDFIVSTKSLTKTSCSTPKLVETYIPLQSKNVVSEAILKDCDFRSSPIDFEDQLTLESISDPKNLRQILISYQNSITSYNVTMTKIINTRSETSLFVQNESKAIDDIRSEINGFRSKIWQINELLSKIDSTKMSTDIHKVSQSVAMLYNRIEEINKQIQQLNNFPTDRSSIEKNENNIRQFAREFDERIASINMKISALQSNKKDSVNENRKIDVLTSKFLENVSDTLKQNRDECNRQIDNLNNTFIGSLRTLKKDIDLREDKIDHQELLKNFEKSREHFKQEFSKSLESNHQNVIRDISTVNSTLSNRIDVSENRIKELDAKCTKNEESMKNSEKNTIQIKDEIFKRVGTEINSLDEKCVSCADGIRKLETQIKKNIEDKLATDEEIKQLKKKISELETKVNTPDVKIEERIEELEGLFIQFKQLRKDTDFLLHMVPEPVESTFGEEEGEEEGEKESEKDGKE